MCKGWMDRHRDRCVMSMAERECICYTGKMDGQIQRSICTTVEGGLQLSIDGWMERMIIRVVFKSLTYISLTKVSDSKITLHSMMKFVISNSSCCSIESSMNRRYFFLSFFFLFFFCTMFPSCYTLIYGCRLSPFV